MEVHDIQVIDTQELVDQNTCDCDCHVYPVRNHAKSPFCFDCYCCHVCCTCQAGHHG